MKKTSLFLFLLFTIHFSLLTFNSFSQGVGINTTGNDAKDAALLEIGEGTSDTKGLLIPRVNLTDVATYAPLTGTPVASLIVYSNTSPTNGNGVGYYYWSGSKWINISSPSNGPGTIGQVLTSSGSGATTWTTPTGGQVIYDAIVDAGDGADYTSLKTACETEGNYAKILLTSSLTESAAFTIKTGQQIFTLQNMGNITIDLRDNLILSSQAAIYGVVFNLANAVYPVKTITLNGDNIIRDCKFIGHYLFDPTLTIGGSRSIIEHNYFYSNDTGDQIYKIITVGGDKNIICHNEFYYQQYRFNDAMIYCTGTENHIHNNKISMIVNSGASAFNNYGIQITGDKNTVANNGIYSNQSFGTGIIISSNNNVVTENIITNFGTKISDSGTGTTLKDNQGSITEEKNYVKMKNTSGSGLVAGNIVVFKSVAGGNEVTTTTTKGDSKVFGVVSESIADAASGLVQIFGKTTVLKANGTTDIAIGDFLTAYTTSGIACKAGAGDMAFAIALEAYATDDNSGVIDALLISPRTIPSAAGAVISGTDNYLSRFNAGGNNVENSGIVDNSDALAVTVDANENVGIGTSNPAFQLEVSKNTNAGVGGRLAITNLASQGVGNSAELVFNTSSGFGPVYNSARIAAISPLVSNATDLVFYTFNDATAYGGDERLRINSIGNVGIGTQSPQSRLEINGYGKMTDQQLVVSGYSGATVGPASLLLKTGQNNTENWNIFATSSATPDLVFRHDWGTEYMRITSDGKVGIGTNNPTAKLQVAGTAGTDGIMFPDGTLQTCAVQTVIVSVSSAEILALHTTGKTLIAAPGAGKIIVIDQLIGSFTYGGIAYTSVGVPNPQLVWAGTTTSIKDASAATVGRAELYGTTNAFINTFVLYGSNIYNKVNTGIEWKNTSADAFTTGNGTVKWFIRYRIITL
ncbi:MAG: hypothetical protein HGB12_03935 [Bacteroidetes bacterium]|nr:hypothetical protein [Bacteroidota bacterium]